MLKRVIAIAEKAGRTLLSYYQTNLKVNMKSDRSPVTIADIEANKSIIQGLKAIDPKIPILSEENQIPHYSTRRKWKRFWLVDPLDGTKEFIKNHDEFTVNIALIENRRPILGVVYAPALNLLYYAQKGTGAWKKDGKQKPRRIYAKKVGKRGPIVVLESRFHSSPKSERLLQNQTRVRRMRVGSSLKFCYLAEGKAHLYPRFSPTMEWDVAAGDCIFRNAAEKGSENKSSLTYNKKSLKNSTFALGLPEASAYGRKLIERFKGRPHG